MLRGEGSVFYLPAVFLSMPVRREPVLQNPGFPSKEIHMNQPWASAFYGSTLWKRCRKDFIASRRGLCERCLKKGIIQPGKEVHHKIRLTAENITDPSVTLNWDNLELLCTPCHEQEHHPAGRYEVSADGKITAREAELR